METTLGQKKQFHAIAGFDELSFDYSWNASVQTFWPTFSDFPDLHGWTSLSMLEPWKPHRFHVRLTHGWAAETDWQTERCRLKKKQCWSVGIFILAISWFNCFMIFLKVYVYQTWILWELAVFNFAWCLFDNSKLDIYVMILAGSSISTKGRLVIARLPPVRVA